MIRPVRAQVRVGVDVHQAPTGPNFLADGRDRRFSLLAEVATGSGQQQDPRGHWQGYLPARRRWMRVFFSSLRCFFLAIRLRRFLMTEPMFAFRFPGRVPDWVGSEPPEDSGGLPMVTRGRGRNQFADG